MNHAVGAKRTATYQAENDDKSALRPTASWATIATIGVVAIIMGLSFVLLRPLIVLLPEDQFHSDHPISSRH